MSNTSLLGSYGGQAGDGLFFRNRILNGCMRIDQRNSGAAVSLPTASSLYTLDRWACNKDTAGATVTAQQSSVVPSGFTKALLLTVSTGAAAGASDQNLFQQIVEGFNVGDLGWGTSSAQSVSVSFWVRSSVTGTYGLSLSNSAANRAYLATYSIDAANTWEYKTVVIPGDTTGTWLTDNSSGIRVRWDFGSGSSRQGTAGSWGTTLFNTVSTRANLIGTSGATLYITGVQLEAGPTATPFERRPYSVELGMCQRYGFDAIGASKGGNYTRIGNTGLARSATNSSITITPPVTLRANPSSVTQTGAASLVYSNTAAAITGVAIDGGACSSQTITLVFTHNSGPTAGAAVFVEASNTQAITCFINAEL